MIASSSNHGSTRREFLVAAAASVLATTLPVIPARAGAPGVIARRGGRAAVVRRMSVASADGSAMLQSYEAGVRAMMALPMTDPRNWYRNAMVHALDCPHDNWWFLPWHRGYLGWFERTIRELSGNPEFALPFWDWTALPSAPPAVPARFFQGLLDPTNDAYIESPADFTARLREPIRQMWGDFTPAQVEQQRLRGNTGADGLLARIARNFAPRVAARDIRVGDPVLDEFTRRELIPDKLVAALRPTRFTEFASVPTANHHVRLAARALETGPHNNVHGSVGGMMGAHLSPVDPLFYLHHANLDRLWTLWTARQRQAGRSALPEGADGQRWGREPFLFFSDAAGKPVAATAAGYAEPTPFEYEYGPGWTPPDGGAVIAGAVSATIRGTLKSSAMVLGQSASASAAVDAATLEAVAEQGDRGASAEISIERAAAASEGARFLVFVNPPEGASVLSAADPGFAGSIRFFGASHHADGASTFTVPLDPALQALRQAGRLETGEALRIEVVPDSDGAPRRPLAAARLQGVSVRVF
jgi:hypothetical protein